MTMPRHFAEFLSKLRPWEVEPRITQPLWKLGWDGGDYPRVVDIVPFCAIRLESTRIPVVVDGEYGNLRIPAHVLRQLMQQSRDRGDKWIHGRWRIRHSTQHQISVYTITPDETLRDPA